MRPLELWQLTFGRGANQVSSARATMISLHQHQHDANDNLCIRWAGDFAGVNLRATCEFCQNVRNERAAADRVLGSP